jgi:hypothetical protein
VGAGFDIEWEDEPGECLGEHQLHPRADISSPPTVGQESNSSSYFSRSQCSDHEIGGVVPVNPPDDRSAWSRSDKFGEDVGVQNDHALKSAARASSPLRGDSRSTPPISAN